MFLKIIPLNTSQICKELGCKAGKPSQSISVPNILVPVDLSVLIESGKNKIKQQFKKQLIFLKEGSIILWEYFESYDV